MERSNEDRVQWGRSLRKLNEQQIKRIKRSDTFTTGMAARLCRVAARTVTKWCDTGQIEFYRLPGSLDRRIRRCDLIVFMKRHGLPLCELEEDYPRLSCLTNNYQMIQALEVDLGEGWKLHKEPCVGSFIMDMVDGMPKLIIIDYNLGRGDCQNVLAAISRLVYKPTVLSIASDDTPIAQASSQSMGMFFWPQDRISLVASIKKYYQERVDNG